MGKTGKWFKIFSTGKKEKVNVEQNSGNNHQNTSTPNVVPTPTTPKEKRRWSFRRSSATAVGPKDTNSAEPSITATVPEKKLETETLASTNAVTDEALAAAAAAASSMISSPSFTIRRVNAIEEAAATKIQSVYRSYLARKALKALRGLVKLQALVRGHLVRNQATATLRCMQALVTAQARARAQRARSVDDGRNHNHRQSTHRRQSHDKIKHSYHDIEDDIKIVEMDDGEFRKNNNRSSYSISSQRDGDRMDSRMPIYYSPQRAFSKQDYQHISPAPSAIADMSPRTCSGHFEDYSFATAQSSPQCYTAMSRPDPSRTPFSFPQPDYAETMSYEYPIYPSYMANTESSRAKARSQSAPKQRPEFERQSSRGRRPSVEGRNNIPKGARMQRSSSQVGTTAANAQNYQYPWSVKLDKSTVSLKDSECGSTCSAFTNANYCRSVVSYDPRY